MNRSGYCYQQRVLFPYIYHSRLLVGEGDDSDVHLFKAKIFPIWQWNQRGFFASSLHVAKLARKRVVSFIFHRERHAAISSYQKCSLFVIVDI